VTAAAHASERRRSKVVSGLPRQLRLILLIALTIVLIDHVAKLGAAWLEPAYYMHNPAPMDYGWVMLLPLLGLFFPSRIIAGLCAVLLGGGASNAIDTYLWPGGVPDFIPMGGWIWNPADFAIYGATFALMGWPVWKLFKIARRNYPESLPTPVELVPARTPE
jgi:hypothetical protein